MVSNGGGLFPRPHNPPPAPVLNRTATANPPSPTLHMIPSRRVHEHALSPATKIDEDSIPAPHCIPTTHRHIAPPPFHVSRPFSPFLLYFTAFIHFFTPPQVSSVVTFSARSPVRRCADARPFVTLLYLDARIRSRTAFAAFDSFYSTFTSHLCSRTGSPFYSTCLHTFYIQIMTHKLAIKTQ